MFCVQEAEHSDPFANAENDPLSNTTQSESSDEEPAAKRHKAFGNSSFDLQVYQIPAFNTPKSLSIFPSTPTSTLPKFVNNPLNLANPLSLTNTAIKNSNSIVKNLHSRYSLPAKLTITPVTTPSKNESGEVVRYKKNGEVAKKRGPPKGYKRKPKGPMFDASALLQNTALLQAHNKILTSLLAASHSSMSMASGPSVSMPPPPPPPQVKVPEGHELVEMQLDPADWFPAEPYRMVFSRKKNPKWKNFPYRCEHCFKGYRVVSTLLTHAAERHGCVPKDMAIPCPCCPHVSTRRKQHKKHLETHEGRRRRIFCLYCLPPTAMAIPCPCCPHVSTRRKQHKKHLETHEGRRRRIFCLYCLPPNDPSEPYVKESVKYPFDKFPQYWYASEESLRLHKKRKHPYAAMFNYNWFGTWGDSMPNS